MLPCSLKLLIKQMLKHAMSSILSRKERHSFKKWSIEWTQKLESMKAACSRGSKWSMITPGSSEKSFISRQTSERLIRGLESLNSHRLVGHKLKDSLKTPTPHRRGQLLLKLGSTTSLSNQENLLEALEMVN